MHLCSACSRRTTNALNDDDDDDSQCALVPLTNKNVFSDRLKKPDICAVKSQSIRGRACSRECHLLASLAAGAKHFFCSFAPNNFAPSPVVSGGALDSTHSLTRRIIITRLATDDHSAPASE